MNRIAGTVFVVFLLAAGGPSFGPSGANAAPPSRGGETPGGIDLSAIDSRVEACHDFYRHACGAFIDATVLSADGSDVSLANEQFDANLQASLARLFATHAPAGSELGRLEAFYASCLNEGPADVAVVRQWLDRIDAIRTPADVQASIRSLHEIGVDPFFSYGGKPDPQAPLKYRGEIDANNVWADVHVVERTFRSVGLSEAQAGSDAAAVGALVAELRKRRNTSVDPADYENPRTAAGLAAIAPAIDWPRYFALIGASPRRPVNLTSAAYLPAVSDVLSTRPVDELRAYLRWSFLYSLRGELPAPYNQAFADVTPARRVAVDDTPRRCRDATVRALGVEFSRQYARHVLGVPAREAATRIARSIRDEIVKSVATIDWLSPAARAATVAKLRRTDLKIGFPDRWPDVGMFSIRRDQFMANVLAARRFEARRAWKRAQTTRTRGDWDMLVAPWVGTGMAAARLVVPNGFPDPYTNSLIMTAAFLNAPRFVGSEAPQFNYGSFGAVFAHEFVHIAETHDFAADGRQQESWSVADIAAADTRHRCVVDQADAYVSREGIRSAGASKVDENVADLGGVRLAYEALANKLGVRLHEPDGTGMTPAQGFFYKYAQTFCTAAGIDTLRKLGVDDPHGLPSYRINGPLSNLPGFGEAFGCREGDTMRRPQAEICRVW